MQLVVDLLRLDVDGSVEGQRLGVGPDGDVLEPEVALLPLLLHRQIHDGGHESLVDDRAQDKEDDHGRGTDPAGSGVGVVGVVGQGEGSQEEVGDDLTVGLAKVVNVRSQALVAIVQIGSV